MTTRKLIKLPGSLLRALQLVDTRLGVQAKPTPDGGDDKDLMCAVTFKCDVTGLEVWRQNGEFVVWLGLDAKTYQHMHEAVTEACRAAKLMLLPAEKDEPEPASELNLMQPQPAYGATTHATVPVGLLIACYHALQSYVHGNTAPALAKACADELAPHLPESAGVRQS